MDHISLILILTIGSGSCIFFGGLLATFERVQPAWLENEFRHFLIALGGGILLGSSAIVLIPEGLKQMQHSAFSILIFLAGGFAFFFLEWLLGVHRREAPQLMGMLLDYVPEAIALGGLILLDVKAATFLAVLIGLQNLPEGFNAYRELTGQVFKSKAKTLAAMAALVLLGPLAGLSGYFIFAQSQAILGALMLFSSGGILYLIFQDIAPQTRLEKHWAPPLGAVLGFGIVLLGQMLTQNSH